MHIKPNKYHKNGWKYNCKPSHTSIIIGASKIFWTYMLPCFLLENMKKIVFQTSNLPLAFQKK